MDKYDQLPSDIQWHMIGHLQRNKVKYIIDKVAVDAEKQLYTRAGGRTRQKFVGVGISKINQLE